MKDPLRFDANGVKEYYAEQERQHWLKEGRKEMAKWIQDNSSYCGDQTCPCFGIRIDPFLLQSFLKEKGIKQ